ncbi:MAG: hypothetical protein KI790_05965 [Cyclobacteriaceae bacterium]|nr:hypothetical protein [Cyclobacteriaceae bacterium HetDA_MAG_MS6]
MKNLALGMLALLLIGISFDGVAQKKERQLKKQVKAKAVKEARKEAKKFRKDGYAVAPGALPMDKQIEKAWTRQYETDDNGFPLYIVASGKSIAESTAAAKLQATELAKLELAGTISTQVGALIENSISTNQLSNEDATSVTKTVGASKNVIAQELGRVLPLFEIYKNVGKNVEANVRIGYNTKLAYEMARKTLKEKLQEETDVAHEKLEKLLNFN